MKVTLLGTGDAPGTPVLGCNCPTCQDAQKGGKSNRLRCSILVETKKGTILLDTGPDLRQQLLEHNIKHVDGVIWTHGHYDHFTGFGEFHRVQRKVDVYGLAETLDYILEYLAFLKPRRNNVKINETFEIIGLKVTLFEVKHRPVSNPVGVIIEEDGKKVVFTGDCEREIPQKSLEMIDSPDLLIADAIVPDSDVLHIKKHMDAKDALKLAQKIKAKEVVFSHMSHFFKPHSIAAQKFPMGYDGMQFVI
ncbi:MBL fold metallo-hydrolase [Methanohalophilus sp.]